MAIVRVLHVALGVRDIERALAFYVDALGFAVLARDAFDDVRMRHVLGADAGAAEVVLLRRDGFLLQLVRRAIEPDDAASSPLRAHLALAVDDLGSTLHSLRDRGVVVEADTLIEHAPGVRSCVVRDPDGLPVLLCQTPSGVSSEWDDEPLEP